MSDGSNGEVKTLSPEGGGDPSRQKRRRRRGRRAESAPSDAAPASRRVPRTPQKTDGPRSVRSEQPDGPRSARSQQGRSARDGGSTERGRGNVPPTQRRLPMAPPDASNIPLDLDSFLRQTLELPEDPPEAWSAGDALYATARVRLASGRTVELDVGETNYVRGDHVLCENGQSLVFGTVVIAPRRTLIRNRPPRIVRRATPGDQAVEAQLRAREHAVAAHARKVVDSLGLQAKVVRAEATNGGQRFILYFSMDEKPDYRRFLQALGRGTRERIELRHIGARDAAKVIGGVGPCGLQLCCNTFLSDFAPVGIRMAKDQGLALNPQKISGVCGRLLCCLVYEEAFYRAQRKLVPRIGDMVMTPQGGGRVRDVDVLAMQVRVVLDSGEFMTSPVGDLAPMKKSHPPNAR